MPQTTEQRRTAGLIEARAFAKAFEAEGIRCNCNLDKWEPERSTGHSRVCRIHKAALDPACRAALTAATKEQSDG